MITTTSRSSAFSGQPTDVPLCTKGLDARIEVSRLTSTSAKVSTLLLLLLLGDEGLMVFPSRLRFTFLLDYGESGGGEADSEE